MWDYSFSEAEKRTLDACFSTPNLPTGQQGQRNIKPWKARTDNNFKTPVTSQISMRLTSQGTGHKSSRRSTLGQLPSGTRCGPWNAPVLELAARCWWSHVAKLASTGVCNVFPPTARDLQGSEPLLRHSSTISYTNRLQFSSCSSTPLGHIVLPSKGWHNVLRDSVAKESKHWWQ